MKIEHDVHMHTYLSVCSDDQQFLPPAIIEKSKANGIRLLGFSDHLWDSAMPGDDSEFYKKQNFDHVNRIHGMMPGNVEGIRILFGCETEYNGNGRIGISGETALKFDFVLVPTNHTLTEFFKDKKPAKAMDISRELSKRFREVISFDVATGICHPFLPLGFMHIGDRILNGLSREELDECFSMAAEKGVSIELNSCTFASNYDRGTEGFTDGAFLRIFTIAKEAGCRFHFGSDAHSLGDIDRLQKLYAQIEILGITEDDINPLFKV